MKRIPAEQDLPGPASSAGPRSWARSAGPRTTCSTRRPGPERGQPPGAGHRAARRRLRGAPARGRRARLRDLIMKAVALLEEEQEVLAKFQERCATYRSTRIRTRTTRSSLGEGACGGRPNLSWWATTTSRSTAGAGPMWGAPRLPGRLPEVTVVKLEQNYRSTRSSSRRPTRFSSRRARRTGALDAIPGDNPSELRGVQRGGRGRVDTSRPGRGAGRRNYEPVVVADAPGPTTMGGTTSLPVAWR